MYIYIYTYIHIYIYTHYSPVALYTHAELRNNICLKCKTCRREGSHAGNVYIVRRANFEYICILGRFAASCGIARSRHAADSVPYDRGTFRIENHWSFKT